MSAPRSLNEPVDCKFSSFKCTLPPCRWLKRSELYAVAGQREANLKTIQDADQWLANARSTPATATASAAEATRR